jgi:hypothetical protein
VPETEPYTRMITAGSNVTDSAVSRENSKSNAQLIMQQIDDIPDPDVGQVVVHAKKKPARLYMAVAPTAFDFD